MNFKSLVLLTDFYLRPNNVRNILPKILNCKITIFVIPLLGLLGGSLTIFSLLLTTLTLITGGLSRNICPLASK